MPSQGPNITGAGTGSGWANLANIAIDDDTFADYDTTIEETFDLKASQFGFSIPAQMVIVGIEMSLRRSADTDAIYSDTQIKLMNLLAPVGDSKDVAGTWTTTPTTITYGSPTDTWGRTWTVAEVNSIQFGAYVQIHANNSGISRSALVHWSKITVYYRESFTMKATFQATQISRRFQAVGY